MTARRSTLGQAQAWTVPAADIQVGDLVQACVHYDAGLGASLIVYAEVLAIGPSDRDGALEFTVHPECAGDRGDRTFVADSLAVHPGAVS